MTGFEGMGIAAAGVVGKEIAKAGEEAGSERKAIKKELLEAAKETDHFAAAADSYAKRIAVKQAIVLRLFTPLARLVGIQKEYFQQEFPTDLAAKLENVPEEHQVTPKPNVAVPAMTGLGLSLDEEALKEMYLNLLATASDDRVTEKAHPSYAEIIKQLTGDEASQLRELMTTRGAIPIVSFRIENKSDGSVQTLYRFVSSWEVDGVMQENTKFAAYVDNWQRLGIVEVRMDQYLSMDGMYDWAESRPEAEIVRGRCGENEQLDIVKGYIHLTDFGEQFSDAVGFQQTRLV